MAFSTIFLLTFITLLTQCSPGLAFFRMPSKVLLAARMDPIVSPNGVSSHEHNIAGGNRFSQNYDYDDLRKSDCTSNLVSVDLSNYWVPGLYNVNKASSTFTYLPSYLTVYYLPRNGSANETISAFPNGLRMVAGNPNRRTYNTSSVSDMAISYVCLDYSGTSTQSDAFPTKQCPDGLRAQVVFPSCWDGFNLDSPNHASHMAYPVDGHPDSGNCPATHPKRLVTLFYEQVFSVDKVSYNGPGSWVLANGDDTGLGYHGDFQTGWDSELLQKAIDQCTNLSGDLDDCPILKPFLDDDAKQACKPANALPNEDVGYRGDMVLGGSLAQLPGCNPIWSGTGPKPTCSVALSTPQFAMTQSELPAGWTSGDCMTDGPGPRVLSGASFVDATGMTRAKCAQFCESKGFSLAGVEWSQECYCGSSLAKSSVKDSDSKCSDFCRGNPYENCGGAAHITLLSKLSSGTTRPSQELTTSSHAASSKTTSSLAHSSSAVAAAQWVHKGCLAEPGSERALWGAYLSDPGMTAEKCTTFCHSKGFSLAGTEYGKECWCDNIFENTANLSQVNKNSGGCSMKCSGSDFETCGGAWYLDLYISSVYSGSLRKRLAPTVHRRQTSKSRLLA